MYRTTNIGVAAWLVSCGHELASNDKDPVTGQVAFYFKPTSEVSAEIHRYRYGDGPEETAARRCNAARIKLSAANLRRAAKRAGGDGDGNVE